MSQPTNVIYFVSALLQKLKFISITDVLVSLQQEKKWNKERCQKVACFVVLPFGISNDWRLTTKAATTRWEPVMVPSVVGPWSRRPSVVLIKIWLLLSVKDESQWPICCVRYRAALVVPVFRSEKHLWNFSLPWTSQFLLDNASPCWSGEFFVQHRFFFFFFSIEEDM